MIPEKIVVDCVNLRDIRPSTLKFVTDIGLRDDFLETFHYIWAILFSLSLFLL